MNAGPAWRIEETAWDDGPPAIPELDTPSDVPASVTRARRASVDTEPASDPFHAPSAERADWCVDMGELLLTMSNFELWTAIERSAVAPWMRVWREGMECWTPVQEVPELRWALASTPEWSLDPTRDEIDEELASGPIALAVNDGPEAARESAVGEEATPSEQGARALSRGSLDDVTPAPMDTTPAPTAADCAPHRETRRGAGWLAGGSAVAAAAIAFALLRAAAHATPIESTRAAVAAEGPRAIATEASEATRAVEAARAIESARVIEAARAIESARAAESARAMKPAAPTRARREERGQRRLPRGGGRAQGR